MQSLINNPYLIGATLGITLLGAAISIFKYFRDRRRNLYSASHRKWVFRRCTFEGEPVLAVLKDQFLQNIIVDYHLISNRTVRVVDDRDFVTLPHIEISGGSIIRCRILSGEGIGYGIANIGSGEVIISDIVLKPGEGILLEVVHTGESRPRIEATLKEQPELVQFQPYSEVYIPLILFGFILLIVSTIASDMEFGPAIKIALLVGSIASFGAAFTFGKRLSMLPAERAFSSRQFAGPPQAL